MFWLLSLIHSFVGNWGWAIIGVTILIKLAFYKLTEASGRSNDLRCNCVTWSPRHSVSLLLRTSCCSWML